MQQLTEVISDYTTYQPPAQTAWLVNIEVTKALYKQYNDALGYAQDAQCEDFDTGPLFSRAYGIGAALNSHLETAFGLDRDDQDSFWDMMKAGFEIDEAITRLQSDHDYRDHRNTIAGVMYAMAGR